MFRNITQSQKNLLLKAGLQNTSLVILVSLAWIALEFYEKWSGHRIPKWLTLTESAASLYGFYRYAFRSVKPAFFKPTLHAAVTAAIVLLQNAVQLTVFSLPINPYRQVSLFSVHSEYVIIFGLAAYGLACVAIGVIVYYFARRRARRVIANFKEAVKTAKPRITGSWRALTLLYALVVTFGCLTLTTSGMYDLIRYHFFAPAINGLSWLVFTIVIWLSITAKPFGKQLFWQTAVPIIIALDLTDIAVTSPGWDLYYDLLLSLPEYTIAAWYAYSFMPAMQHYRIKKIDKEKLFV